MILLAYDTETTGLPKKGPAPIEAQPHVLQLALSLYDNDARPIFELSTLIRPEEGEVLDIHPQALEVHGITAEMCWDLGIRRRTAMALLSHAAQRATHSCAHNASFDLQLLGFTAKREGATLPPLLLSANNICTCDVATPVLNIPPTAAMLRAGRTGPKRANLGECYQFFFGEELVGAHDALVDTRACARVFFELRKRGAIVAS